MVWVASALVSSGALLAQVPTPNATSLLPISEVRPGMRGYGLTVFRGLRPERFDVEVIDVVHNFRPRMDVILIRPSHPTLDHAGTVGGMSGSPIYLEGRLAGAYAYGWEFGRDPVAGVTPIHAMLAELQRPRRTPPGLMPGYQLPIEIRPRPSLQAREGAPHDPWDALATRATREASPVPTPYGALVPVASPMMVGGLGNAALRTLTEALEPFGVVPVQAGGGGSRTVPPDAPSRYENGGAVAVRVLEGDISGNITGTVTHVEGSSLVAFGHPMMGLGETALPTSIARVMWILASERRSVKISEPVRPLGALVQDRPSTIVVDARAPAPTLPVRVRVQGIDGAPHSEWNVTVAGHRVFAGRLTGAILQTALEDTAGDHGDVAWTVRSHLRLRGRAPVDLVELGTSAEGTQRLTSSTSDFITRLMNNPFGIVAVDGVDLDVSLRWANELTYIRSVGLSREEADPGATVDLRVSLGRYGMPPELRTIPIELPRNLAGSDVDLEVTGGADATPEQAEPESLDDLVRNLSTRFPEDSLVVTVRMPGQALALRGRVINNLPGSAFDVLRPPASTDTGEPLYNLRTVVVPVGRAVVGRDRVRVRVREVRQ